MWLFVAESTPSAYALMALCGQGGGHREQLSCGDLSGVVSSGALSGLCASIPGGQVLNVMLQLSRPGTTE